MRRVLTFVGGILTLMGVIFLAVGVGIGIDSLRFRADSVVTTGTVVDVEQSESCHEERDRDDPDYGRETCSTVYQPTVTFRTESGREVTFQSNVGTSRQPEIGSKIPVRYRPDSPESARVDEAATSLVLPGVFTLVGVVLLGVGIPMLASAIRKGRVAAWLDRSGTRVQAQLLSPQLETNVRINGQHPWRVYAQWHDPASGREYTFRSDHLTQEPTAALQGHRTIDVLIDPDRPMQRYRIDLESVGLG